VSEQDAARRTLVTFLLDRTGAVEKIRDQTIAAFTAYLDALKEGNDLIEFTFIVFDGESFNPIHIGTPIQDVPHLERTTYVSHLYPSEPGVVSLPSTEVVLMREPVPLIDATWKTIAMVANSLRKRDDKPNIVICIQVSGAEGCSTEHTWEELRTLITLKAAHGWQFNFLGTGCAVYEHGTLMGIPAPHIAECSRQSDDDGGPVLGTKTICKVFRTAAQNVVAFAQGSQTSTAFSAPQKAEFGEQNVRRHADYEAAIEWIRSVTVPIY
jgi:hypothetical protein